ncbi:hypothetical protein FS837_002283 [Tulasnella sp. UAMH 9824]|nr:hypothetical protein FS837_002283 [Tulasnella sp. UAMH 9824]
MGTTNHHHTGFASAVPANFEPICVGRGSRSALYMAHPTAAPVVVKLESKSTLKAGINSVLPPELLALAFSFPFNDAVDAISFNAHGGPDEAEVQKRFRQHPLWNASLVCRAWYGIIKNTPRFWTFVAVGFTSLPGPSESTGDPPTSHLPHPKERLRAVEVLLERSGSLPLTVVLGPENILDLSSISQALHKHFDRLEILSLVASDKLEPRRQTPPQTTLDQALELLAGPMPKLKFLSISRSFPTIMYGIADIVTSVHRKMDAPQLETISCHAHLIIPSSPTRLSSLSLIQIDIDQGGQSSVELPHLVDLRIEKSKPGAILSTLIIPSLRRLVVKAVSDYSNIPAQLPRHNSLQELQWFENGYDPVFAMLCRVCPNLKRYLNYIEEDSIEKDIENADKFFSPMRLPLMILTVFDQDVLGGVNTYRHWPILEEVLLDRASCDVIAMFIRTVPSIKRVRVLRDPSEFYGLNFQEGERHTLAVLQGKVEIAIREEPWGGGWNPQE